jgi:hypothetical protein
MNPISAADTADFSHPEILWNSMARSASAASSYRLPTLYPTYLNTFYTN